MDLCMQDASTEKRAKSIPEHNNHLNDYEVCEFG